MEYAERKDGTIKVYADNGVHVGDVTTEVDGYYVFYPILRGGYWDAWMLRDIAEYIDSLNESVDSSVKEFYAKQSS